LLLFEKNRGRYGPPVSCGLMTGPILSASKSFPEHFLRKGFRERVDPASDAISEIFAPLDVVALTPDEWERID
jgi:hypothetical protein